MSDVDRIIIDDVDHSKVDREAVLKWFRESLKSRAEGRGVIILANGRRFELEQDDASTD